MIMISTFCSHRKGLAIHLQDSLGRKAGNIAQKAQYKSRATSWVVGKLRNSRIKKKRIS